jgi:hypothetical protein
LPCNENNKDSRVGYPEDNVVKKKIQNLVNASQEFLFINPEWKPVSV